MQSAIRESTWYKNVTKDFIDTTPPKPPVPAKKNASVTRHSNSRK